MKIQLDELKTFKYKEFAYRYLNDFLNAQPLSHIEAIGNFFKMSPKKFFEISQKAGYFNENFINNFRENYGDLWVSDMGYIDMDAIYSEICSILRKNNPRELTPSTILKYIVADIIVANESLHDDFKDYCDNESSCFFEKDVYEIHPIDNDYRNLKEGVLKEISINETEKEEEALEELFEAAYSLVTDETELAIIKKIEKHVKK